MRVSSRVESVPGWVVYTISVSGVSQDQMDRAVKILDAAKLQIEDRAPDLFTGPPPLNTNPTDLDNYQH